ncbi:MAG TPA: lipid A deacylase LpxR family protein [Deltaproteobacteria bacterium]|nr:lipid A deacylase LpxR family protein [Deltaproteobacteria bacterium]
MRQNTCLSEGLPCMKLKYFFVLFAIAFLTPGQYAAASEDRARSSDTLTIYLENDLFGLENRDRYYTHGTKLSWISRDLTRYRDIIYKPQWAQRIIESLPYLNDPQRLRTVSVSLGQSIYTPEDKETEKLISDDRPYAGITYLGLGLHSRNHRFMDTLELNIGILGPHSYAENCQRIIHEWAGSVDPRGWDNQLHDELIVNLYVERKWKARQLRNTEGFGFDFIPHVGMAVGNAYTGANLGGQVRFGWNIPNDFGTYLIRAGSDSSAPLDDTDPRFFPVLHRFGIHFFFGVDGKAIARNILLDGNTFRSSHSVDKNYFVADFIGGMGIIIHRFKFTYSYVYRTKEFKKQKDEHKYGAISLSYTF